MGLHFNGAGGTDATFSGTGLPTGTSVRTSALWFKCATSSPGNFVLLNWGSNSTGQRWDLFYDGSSHLGLECTNGAQLFSWTPDTNWHHLAIVLPSGATDSDHALVYLDGVLKTKASGTNQTLNTTTSNPQFGQLNAAGGFGFAGDMAEAAIWTADLTAVEIQALAGGAIPKRMRPAKLFGYWPFTGSLPNFEPDFSGNGVTLTLNNTTASTNHAPVVAFSPMRSASPLVTATVSLGLPPQVSQGLPARGGVWLQRLRASVARIGPPLLTSPPQVPRPIVQVSRARGAEGWWRGGRATGEQPPRKLVVARLPRNLVSPAWAFRRAAVQVAQHPKVYVDLATVRPAQAVTVIARPFSVADELRRLSARALVARPPRPLVVQRTPRNQVLTTWHYPRAVVRLAQHPRIFVDLPTVRPAQSVQVRHRPMTWREARQTLARVSIFRAWFPPVTAPCCYLPGRVDVGDVLSGRVDMDDVLRSRVDAGDYLPARVDDCGC